MAGEPETKNVDACIWIAPHLMVMHGMLAYCGRPTPDKNDVRHEIEMD